MAHFVKLDSNTREGRNENTPVSQNNIVAPENRYPQIFKIQVRLSGDQREDRQGILRSIDRCTVTNIVQAGHGFVVEEVNYLDAAVKPLLVGVCSVRAVLIGSDRRSPFI